MQIRNMIRTDAEAVIAMMRVFYASPAVYTNGSEEIFQADVEACISGSPYLEGYVLEENRTVAGYAMVAKSFSTEFGKPCIWLEDIYIRDGYRGKGFFREFMNLISEKYPNALIRLEAEEENHRAVHVYRKAGFQTLPYLEMIRINQ